MNISHAFAISRWALIWALLCPPHGPYGGDLSVLPRHRPLRHKQVVSSNIVGLHNPMKMVVGDFRPQFTDDQNEAQSAWVICPSV